METKPNFESLVNRPELQKVLLGSLEKAFGAMEEVLEHVSNATTAQMLLETLACSQEMAFEVGENKRGFTDETRKLCYLGNKVVALLNQLDEMVGDERMLQKELKAKEAEPAAKEENPEETPETEEPKPPADLSNYGRPSRIPPIVP